MNIVAQDFDLILAGKVRPVEIEHASRRFVECIGCCTLPNWFGRLAAHGGRAGLDRSSPVAGRPFHSRYFEPIFEFDP